MFFIYNDKTQSLERKEYGTAGTQDYIIRILRKLLLPYLHTFGITVLGMIDTQAITEHTLQALHHLHCEGNLRHKEKHLTMLIQLTLYKMDVNLCLTTGGDAMQQSDLLFHKRQQNLIIGILLGMTQRLNMFWVRSSSLIQSSHLNLIGLQHTTLHQLVYRRKRGL